MQLDGQSLQQAPRQGLYPWLMKAAPAGLLAEEFFEPPVSAGSLPHRAHRRPTRRRLSRYVLRK